MRRVYLIFILLLFVAANGNIPSTDNFKTEIGTSFWNAYIDNANNIIEKNWNPPETDSTKSTILNYTIGKNGELLDIEILKSSGNYESDNAAIEAIKKSAPFEPLPKEYLGQSVSVEYKFKYNVAENEQIQPEINYKNTPLWKTYVNSLNKTIRTNWNPPKINTEKNTVINITLKDDGELADLKIIESSDNELMDRAAVEAIIKSVPFNPIPEKFNEKTVSFDYTFNHIAINNATKTYSTKTPQWRNYLSYLNYTIKTNWNPPKKTSTRMNIAVLTIRKDGALVAYRMIETTGIKEVDESAIEAIMKSAPFKPLPKEYGGEYVSIKFMFDRNYKIQTQNIPTAMLTDSMDLLFYLNNKKQANK